MYSEARKLELISKLQKVSDEDTLLKVEAILKPVVEKKSRKPDWNIIAGMLTEEEAEQMRQAIHESCEQIDENDWK